MEGARWEQVQSPFDQGRPCLIGSFGAVLTENPPYGISDVRCSSSERATEVGTGGELAYPLHDWASHGADALATFATGFEDPRLTLVRSAESARFDGFVAKYMGDGVLIYFGYPHAHEDDAERALVGSFHQGISEEMLRADS